MAFDPMAMNMPDAPAAPDAPITTSATDGLTDQELSDLTSAADTSINDLYSNVNNATSTQGIAQAKQISDLQAQVTALTASNTTANTQAALDAANKAITNQNALAMLQSTLSGYGIDPTGEISNAILGLQQKNYDAQTIQSLIQDPTSVKSTDTDVAALANAWNTRFSANVARQAAGLPVLSTATYLANEQQYKQVMQQAGLPASVITNDYVGKIMAADVSPLEMQTRINAATTAITAEDPYVIQQLNQMGLGTGDLALHLLDPATASNVIAQKVSAAQIGAEAARQNVNTSQAYNMQLASQGVTQAQAAQGFQNVAVQLPGMQSLAQRYAGYGPAGTVGQSLENQQFGTSSTGETAAEAEQRLKRLQTQETSAFGGSAGASTQGQSLGIGTAQGVS